MFLGRKPNEFELLCLHFGHVSFESVLGDEKYLLSTRHGIRVMIFERLRTFPSFDHQIARRLAHIAHTDEEVVRAAAGMERSALAYYRHHHHNHEKIKINRKHLLKLYIIPTCILPRHGACVVNKKNLSETHTNIAYQ